MLAAFTDAVTDEVSGVSPTVIVPSNSVNTPRTLEVTRWRAMKLTVEWTASTV